MAQPTERLTPQQQRAHYKMMAGVTDLQTGQRDAARAKFEEALDLDHELIDARLWLAHVLLEDGEPEPATQQYQTGLMFSPQDERLMQGLQAAQSAVTHAATPEARDNAAAKQRLVPNLILAGLLPPSGLLLGLWEIVTGRTQEWKDLGLKTLLASIAALFAWLIVLGFIGVVLGGIESAGAGP